MGAPANHHLHARHPGQPQRRLARMLPQPPAHPQIEHQLGRKARLERAGQLHHLCAQLPRNPRFGAAHHDACVHTGVGKSPQQVGQVSFHPAAPGERIVHERQFHGRSSFSSAHDTGSSSGSR